MEPKCWSDQTKWQPIDTQPPPVMTNEEDFGNLGYTEENLFDEKEEELLKEHVDMELILEANEEEFSNENMVEPSKHDPNAKTWIWDKLFGFTAMNTKKKRNLDLTICKALAREDRRHWEEAMQTELNRLEAMGTWEVAGLPKGMNMVDVRGLAPETQLGTININVMMTPRSGVSVDDDEVDGIGDEIGDVDDNEVDGVGDKVGGVNTSVQCVDLMLEVIPRPQWTTAFGSILIRTANLLWVPSDIR
ncbi:hypothetical protein NDA11_004607 [Ustilago hordei]|uniref:Uncharacterized protein n=1 Tax=Ustilago hordei TaxID=120017 RepID=I2FSZ5_USTHO|nr:hypothetical protein NDA10_003523 [Ustilago hordei]KAJ1570829.1 hypothetical protein NDA11_004607 [Ustilago hordei]KAJ1587445.1 hypothetical protein NDA15_005662 [Ustilago hordei]KAJ1590465.1 hypothetical protein NDA12_007525 [Ustilago hordei]UTT96549.1 hypothetical protein NDA17_001992 [Ustilago hordei]